MDIGNLLKKMHQTKGARFESHKRYTAKNYYSNFTISILSFYVICISVGLLVFDSSISNNLKNWFTFVSVALSVLIIIITLLDGSQRYDVKAELMHNCARDINELYNRCKLEKEPNEVRMGEFTSQYQMILFKYQFNHDEIDRKMYSANSPFDKSEKIEKPAVEYWMDVFGLNIFYLFAPIVVGIFIISCN